MFLITNNPLVLKKYPKSIKIKGSYKDVLLKGRDYIHQGHRLLIHPLAGSVKPNETPYKSLLLTDKNDQGLDYNSLSLIENAIITTDKFIDLERRLPAQVDQDFQVVDLSLLEAAKENMTITL